VNEAWTDWQREHASALAALQDAQRAYHRAAVATSVGSQQSAGGSQQSAGGSRQPAVGSREEALEALDAARVKLDEVRARMPR
jgi:hypothetical protein